MVTMRFYWRKENGLIIVENWVMGMKGQTHSHTPAEFEEWKKNVPEDDLIDVAKL